MCYKYANTWEVCFPKLSPHTLVEATDPIICISSTFSIWDAVKEVAIISSLLPHPLHFGRAWLEVSKILLSQAGLFKNLYLVAGKWGWAGVV